PRPDAELDETAAQRLHALRDLPVSDRPPYPVGLVPERGGMARVALHAGKEQLGEGAGAHDVNRTVNLTGEPGSRALTPRLALAVTSTLAGAGPAMRRSRTAAMPRTSVVTVSIVTSACAVSLVTRVTGPGVVGDVMAKTTARPASGLMAPVAATVSPTSTLKESESESGGMAERCAVSTIGPVARSVSATATPRNRTKNVSGEPGTVSRDPGTVSRTARRAIATTTTLSGMVSGASRRTLTNAMPDPFETAVSVVTTACAVSRVTSVTGPRAVGWTMVYTTGRPASGTIGFPPALTVTVSAISILSESDSESSVVGPAMSTVSRVGPAGNTVSAAASVRIATGFETRPPPRATAEAENAGPQGASAGAAWVGPAAARSRRAWVACSIHFGASGPLGGCARTARRCWVAPSGSPRLSSRNASP